MLVSAVILVCSLSFFPLAGFCQDVLVITDKVSCAPGDKVNIIITNNSPHSIFSIAATSTPEFSISCLEKRAESGEWERLRVSCSFPECDVDFDPPAEITSGQTIWFSWQPRIYSKSKYLDPEEGVYRIKINWQHRQDKNPENWIWGEAQTNSFVISKDSPSQENP